MYKFLAMHHTEKAEEKQWKKLLLVWLLVAF